MGFVFAHFLTKSSSAAAAVVFIPLAFVWQALYSQYLQFKDYDIPLKENEKTKIKNLYKMLEVYTHTHTHSSILLPLPDYAEQRY